MRSGPPGRADPRAAPALRRPPRPPPAGRPTATASAAPRPGRACGGARAGSARRRLRRRPPRSAVVWAAVCEHQLAADRQPEPADATRVDVRPPAAGTRSRRFPDQGPAAPSVGVRVALALALTARVEEQHAVAAPRQHAVRAPPGPPRPGNPDDRGTVGRRHVPAREPQAVARGEPRRAGTAARDRPAQSESRARCVARIARPPPARPRTTPPAAAAMVTSARRVKRRARGPLLGRRPAPQRRRAPPPAAPRRPAPASTPRWRRRRPLCPATTGRTPSATPKTTGQGAAGPGPIAARAPARRRG